MKPLKIVHLVDDCTPGGVMRMLDNLLALPDFAGRLSQTVKPVSKNALGADRHDADVVVSHLSLRWRGLPALMTLRALNPTVRLVHIEHSYTPAFSALNVPNKRRFHTMLRVSYALFDRVVAVSNEQAKWMQARNLVQPEALSVIHPQVDMTGLADIAPVQTARPVIGAFGRLEPQKGFDMLIEAFRMCPQSDAQLLFFGEGDERGRLETLAGPDPRITFCGHTDDVRAAYAAVSMVAMPSRWEAFGLVAQEARAAGRPVLVADVDGLRDQAGNGIRVQSGRSAEAWAAGLQKMMTEPPVCETGGMARGLSEPSLYAARWLRVFTGSSLVEQPLADTTLMQAV
ncbi:glycosyltransferase family 4 protein [uncultured Roseobacter sp.]|uniref:glycosyltransferase family 4 protein n=1 Tax=uncultured Roseobacter sp. TaxID=114847 RepID=UPI0026072010|nr:glycosyltransferase family 4 protein [uncultured Roseobacter sp.]